jgi:NAD+ kinase
LTSVLDQIESDAIAPHKILRLQLSVNGAVLPELVLNEVLVAHTNPAATSRYFIESRAVKEEQRSSGIWIGPPAGSTGSLRSAGAPVMKITDHRFQYFVREPCMRPTENWQLIHGVLAEDDELHIVSQMRTGNLYLDGQHIDYQFGIGDKLIVKASPNYLLSYIEPDVNDIFLQTAHSAATS